MSSTAPGTTAERVRAEPREDRVRIPRDGPLTPEQAVAALRRDLERGDPWYPALLNVIARWVAPAEDMDDGLVLSYLVGGEAFDWLLLAQRLLADVADLVPAEEAERLVVHGLPPEEQSDEEFEEAIGPQKYRAHLNFQYGVVVEELLLLAVELELQKAGRLSGIGERTPEAQAYEHVYGKTLDELQVLYRSETDRPMGDRVSHAQLREFTYWCFKYRMRMAEPARVASDTKKALALMSRLERGRLRLSDLAGRRRPRRFTVRA